MYRACRLIVALVLGVFFAIALSHLEQRPEPIARREPGAVPLDLADARTARPESARPASARLAEEMEATADPNIPDDPPGECTSDSEPVVQLALQVPGQEPTLAESKLEVGLDLKADDEPGPASAAAEPLKLSNGIEVRLEDPQPKAGTVAAASAETAVQLARAEEPAKPEKPAQPQSQSGETAGPQGHTALKPVPEPDLFWHDDYAPAYREAKEDGRLLFIYFYDPQQTATRRSFETKTLANPQIKAKLAEYVLLKLPRDAVVTTGGQRVALLQHASFGEMLRREGIAMVDLAHKNTEYYGHVVSSFPFTLGKYYRGPALDIILSLPPGTLTQRTMIYAVRIHPEGPASTQGKFINVLADEAKAHSAHQAAILVQGHHNWENRFHRINARLPSGVSAQEVVAESWPNESLVDACVDCVDSWRHSPGHWNAVVSRHPVFGFDIKRGRNGIWYATGIFGRR
jgi:hypothetical protein